jgi:L-lactate dehydrogenase complex protein LldG
LSLRETAPGATPPTGATSADLIGEFSRRLEAVGGEVHTCGPAELPPLVERILEDLGARSVLLAQGPRPLEPSLAQALEARGITCLPAALPAEAERRADRLPRLDAADAGVCVALAGLAETGTVVVGSGPEGALLASLLPPACLVILPAGDVHAGLSAWLQGSGSRSLQSHASLSLVTGPSRTADIEMTLTMGVHGPGRWIVVIVRSAPG